MDSVCVCDRCQGIEWMIEEELKMQEGMDFDIDVDLDDFDYPEQELDSVAELPQPLPQPKPKTAIQRIVAKLELKKRPAGSVGL